MHGLIGKALQHFAVDTYGEHAWRRAARAGGAPPGGFESMRRYPSRAMRETAQALANEIGTDLDDLLTDVGVYLVAHPSADPLRRLMRFTGTDFDAFLHALEEMPARGRLAVPDLDLPAIELRLGPSLDDRRSYALRCVSAHAGAGHILLGLLRGMADDYGALALIAHEECAHHEGHVIDRLSVEVVIDSYAAGRGFDLAGAAR